MTTQFVLDIALANDDPYPDDVCPGCGADVCGWRDWSAHYPPGGESYSDDTKWKRKRDGRSLRFTNRTTVTETCEWTRDYLVARAHRRRLIDEGVTR